MSESPWVVQCPACGTDVANGPPCRICRDGGRCCPCFHEGDDV